MFKLSLAWLSLVHFGSGKMDFRATAAHNTNSKSTPRSSAKTDTQFWWVPVVTSAKPFVRLRNNVSPPHDVQHALGDSAWHHPRSLLETIIATHRASALISVHVRSHSCDSLQCNSVKSGFNQKGAECDLSPLPVTLCGRWSSLIWLVCLAR